MRHRWCRIRRNQSHHTATSRRLKKTCRSAVALVPQASQPQSANYTAHSTHREDRKAKRRAAEAAVLPYEFRPVCWPSVRQAWRRPTWPTFFQLELPVIPHSGPHPRAAARHRGHREAPPGPSERPRTTPRGPYGVRVRGTALVVDIGLITGCFFCSHELAQPLCFLSRTENVQYETLATTWQPIRTPDRTYGSAAAARRIWGHRGHGAEHGERPTTANTETRARGPRGRGG